MLFLDWARPLKALTAASFQAHLPPAGTAASIFRTVENTFTHKGSYTAVAAELSLAKQRLDSAIRVK